MGGDVTRPDVPPFDYRRGAHARQRLHATAVWAAVAAALVAVAWAAAGLAEQRAAYERAQDRAEHAGQAAEDADRALADAGLPAVSADEADAAARRAEDLAGRVDDVADIRVLLHALDPVGGAELVALELDHGQGFEAELRGTPAQAAQWQRQVRDRAGVGVEFTVRDTGGEVTVTATGPAPTRSLAEELR